MNKMNESPCFTVLLVCWGKQIPSTQLLLRYKMIAPVLSFALLHPIMQTQPPGPLVGSGIFVKPSFLTPFSVKGRAGHLLLLVL